MKNYKIAITTGDKLGIGKEITQKALLKLNPNKEDVLIIGEKIDVDYDFIEINEENNGKFCYKSLEMACKLAQEGKIKGIVTSPVSKLELNKAGYNFNGQTEVIESLLAHDNQKAQMIFIANDLKVMLLTRHLALNEIKLNQEEIIFQSEILNNFLKEKYKINATHGDDSNKSYPDCMILGKDKGIIAYFEVKYHAAPFISAINKINRYCYEGSATLDYKKIIKQLEMNLILENII